MPGKAPVDTVRKVLFTALDALHDYIPDLVIVGGWVPQIYAWKEKSPEMPVHSYDVDAAVGRKVPFRGDKSISELLKNAGFKSRIADSGFALATFGKKKPQMTQFFYRKGKLEVPVEFITPLVGRGEEASVAVQGDLVISALRFTDILLAHTQTVSVVGETLEGKKKRFSFNVPTLSAFVYAKGLIFPRRNEIAKKGKDLAYIFEILSRPGWNKQVVAGLPGVVKKHPENWSRTFRRNLDEAFKTQGSRGPAWVALQYPNRPAEEVRKESFSVFRDFLDG